MLVLAAYGLHGLYRLMAGKRLARRLLTVLLSLCMALTGVGIVTQHPYQYAYEQPLVRLLTGQDDLERDYWNVSVLNALETLAGQTDGEIVIAPGRPLGAGRAGKCSLRDGAWPSGTLQHGGGA